MVLGFTVLGSGVLVFVVLDSENLKPCAGI
jgi:hypothetical protein